MISVDPSLRSLGIFYVEDGEANSEVIQRKEGDRIEILGKVALKFAKEAALGWDLLVIESYAFGAGNSRSITVQAELGGLIRGLFAAYRVPIVEVPISTWKKVCGISLKKGDAMATADYLNAVAKKYRLRFKTTDEADAFLLYQCVRECALKNRAEIGAQSIRDSLGRAKIDMRKLGLMSVEGVEL